MSGAVLSWITCINELSSSIMLYSGKTSTIAVAIYQEVVRMSDGTAAALATILTLTTIVSLVIVFRATKGTVSYTHLAVYKRQPEGSAPCGYTR